MQIEDQRVDTRIRLFELMNQRVLVVFEYQGNFYASCYYREESEWTEHNTINCFNLQDHRTVPIGGSQRVRPVDVKLVVGEKD